MFVDNLMVCRKHGMLRSTLMLKSCQLDSVATANFCKQPINMQYISITSQVWRSSVSERSGIVLITAEPKELVPFDEPMLQFVSIKWSLFQHGSCYGALMWQLINKQFKSVPINKHERNHTLLSFSASGLNVIDGDFNRIWLFINYETFSKF